MFLYKEFSRRVSEYLQHIEITNESAEKIAEVLFYIAEDFFEKYNFNSHLRSTDELVIKRRSVFESKNFKNFFIENVSTEILKHLDKDKNTLINKITYRAYFSKNEVFSQKKAMIENRARSCNIKLILAAIDISSDEEIYQMYITVRALKDKLDEKTYSKIRKFARKKYKSCRIEAKYFLYLLSQIEDFENKKERAEENKNTRMKKHKKTKKKIDKNTEVYTSEADFKIYKKNEKLDRETRYKLYLYRQKYREELQNTRLKRLTKDNLLFFLINTEKLVENESLTLQQVLKIIKYADSNQKIRNSTGWLIERFQIGRGRFYFLLRKSKHEQTVEKECSKSDYSAKSNSLEQEKQNYVKDIYINSDLLYFARKYNVSEDEILSYLSKFKYLSGDVSYIVEHYLANKIYKNLPREEKQKLISYAKKRIRSFAVPPSTEEEFKKEIKSIIAAKIKDDYLTLTIQDRLRLQMSGQYDTS